MADLYHMDTVLLLATVTFLLYKYFTRNFDYWKRKGVPYIKPTPFIGNFAEAATFKKPAGHMLRDMSEKIDGPYFGIWVFNSPHLVVKSPELIKQILVKDFKYFNERTIHSQPEIDMLGASTLFALRNPEWKLVRSKMTPVFTSGKIKNMIPLMNEAAEDMKHYLVKHSARGGSLEAKEICAKFSTDLLTSCAFGLRANSFESEDAPFRNVGRQIFDYNLSNGIRFLSYFFVPILVKVFKIALIPRQVSAFLRQAFWQTIEQREKTNTKRNDVIDLIIKMKNEENLEGINFEGDKIVAQAVQFFIAGFETTSSTMAFTLYELCLNKSIQQKLRAEIKNTLREYEGEVSYEAVQSMKYLNKVVSETLRKYPVLPFLDRRCMVDYKIPDSDLVLEKGTPVYIPMFGLHYDPKYFPDPEKYDPERFNEENINSRPNYSYIPFGSGPHNCIGERFGLIVTKLGLVHILSKFEVERTNDTRVPLKFATKSLILAAEGGLPMRFVDCSRRLSIAA